jgi:hypothetical protein
MKCEVKGCGEEATQGLFLQMGSVPTELGYQSGYFLMYRMCGNHACDFELRKADLPMKDGDTILISDYKVRRHMDKIDKRLIVKGDSIKYDG